MGLGPSIKMTTLHHYNCPVTKQLMADKDVNLLGVLVDGVSEGYDDKVRTAVETAVMAEELKADGAVVAIDGWGNHHIDFVSVIEQLGIRGIPSVGLSYIGRQGRLVCTNEYVETIVDFNKSVSGYESCVVGQNNLAYEDAYKAVGLIKHKVRRAGFRADGVSGDVLVGSLTRTSIPISGCGFGFETSITGGVSALKLKLNKGTIGSVLSNEPRLENIEVAFVSPGERRDFFVNSNLDFMPIAHKTSGRLGEGNTHQLGNVIVMLTGVEDKSGFQPANIGSSEGLLSERVAFDRAGTPKSTDTVLHIDILFKEGEGRTLEGLEAAHRAGDTIVQEIRKAMRSCIDAGALDSASLPDTEDFRHYERKGRMKLLLVKIVSGLGNMYDTAVGPDEPAGFIGSVQMRAKGNSPILLTPTEVLDGTLHSLL